MKSKWMKRALALGTAVLVGLSSLTAFAAEPSGTEAKVVKAEREYYQQLINKENPEQAPTAATISLTKKVKLAGKEFDEATAAPIQDVKFVIVKVGHFAQLTKGETTSMVYAIDNTLANELKLSTEKIAHTDDNYTYVKDYKDINEALQSVTSAALKTAYSWTSDNETATNENGQITKENQEFGLYLIVETDVSGAKVDGESVTITKLQFPYVVSAPIYIPGEDGTDGTWSADVDAKAKNETGTADSEKKIIRDTDSLPTVGAADLTLVDNDNTHIGDEVVFRLTNGVIDLPSDSNADVRIEKYTIEDVLSKGFTFDKDDIAGNLQISDSNGIKYEYGEDKDYTVTSDETKSGDWTDVEEDATPEGKTYITIEFTETGLGKLTTLAKLAGTDKEVFVDYKVTVNQDAEVGTAGNPNDSRLEFKANGGPTITTKWDKVKEYIFTMDGTKTFDGQENADFADSVKFELYTKGEDGEKIAAPVTKTADGEYVYGGTSNVISLSDSKFEIKGVPTGVDLYLKETETKNGYNLLQDPIEIKLTAYINENGSDNSQWGTLTAGTVNSISALRGDKDGVTFTVDNTSGFELPSTGGMGTTIFAAIGILIVAAGGIFYAMTGKKKA